MATIATARANRSKLSIDNARIQFDSFSTGEFITQVAPIFSKGFQALARNGAKSRVIIGAIHNEDLVESTLEKIRPNGGDFVAKLIYKSLSMPYHIIDHKEVWIPTQKKLNQLPHVFYGRMTRR